MYIAILLILIGIFIGYFGIMIRLDNNGKKGGIPFIIFGALVLIGSFVWGFYNEPKIELKKAQYEENTILKTKSAKIVRLDMLRNRSNTESRLELMMTLEDGTIADIDNKLFAKLKEGDMIYWDICIENCKYYKFDNTNRNYYLKED